MPERTCGRVSTGMDSRLKHAGMTLKDLKNLFDVVLSLPYGNDNEIDGATRQPSPPSLRDSPSPKLGEGVGG
jgi:hypothetical protein